MQKIILIISIFFLVLPGYAFAATSLNVETKTPIEITYNSAQISADVTAGDTPDNVYWFEWGISGDTTNTVFKTPEYSVGSRYTRTSTYTLRGLAPSTQYYYRAVAENQNDHVEGRTIYFTTKSYDTPAEAIVIVSTRGVTALKDTSVTMHAYVAPHTESARYWFEYGTNQQVGELTSDHSINRDGGEVTTDLHGLDSGTTYYYRIVAENDRGIVRGSILSFTTTGIAPVNEAKTTQKIGSVSTTKTAAESGNTTDTTGTTGFGGFFGSTNAATSNKTSNTDNTTVKGNNLSGSVGSTVKDISVSVQPIGNAGVHQTIEYKVAYAYNRSDSAKKARFEITLPGTLVYIGDTTARELQVKDADNGARTYTLPIGSIKYGDSRTFSIIAMTTADAKGIPAVNAKLIFTTSNNQQLVAGVAAAKVGSAFGNSSSGSSSFPTTLVVWLIIINAAIASLIGVIRAKEWYVATQARLKETEEKAKTAAAQIKADLTGKVVPAMVVVPEQQAAAIPERPVIHQFEQELDAVKGEEIDQFGLPGAYTVTA